jgi:hypothetical protein
MHQHMWWTINVDRTAGELSGRLESHLLAMICHDFYASAHATNPSPRFFNTIFGIIFASAMFYFEGAQGSGIATLQKTLGKYSRHQQTSAESTWEVYPVLVRTIVRSWAIGSPCRKVQTIRWTHSSPIAAFRQVPGNQSRETGQDMAVATV